MGEQDPQHIAVLPYNAVHAWLMTSKHTVPDLYIHSEVFISSSVQVCMNNSYASSMFG